MGRIVAITGNMCAGKNTLRRKLQNEGFQYILPTTTREPKYDERMDLDYNFVTGSVFDRLSTGGTFIEETYDYSDTGKELRYGWWKMDFEENEKAPTNKIQLVILPIDIAIKLVEKKKISAVVVLRCSPFVSFYRQIKRDKDIIDVEMVRILGNDEASWRTLQSRLYTVCTEHHCPMLTYWTDVETVDPVELASKLTRKGK